MKNVTKTKMAVSAAHACVSSAKERTRKPSS
jgi:hypothetical protein